MVLMTRCFLLYSDVLILIHPDIKSLGPHFIHSKGKALIYKVSLDKNAYIIHQTADF